MEQLDLGTWSDLKSKTLRAHNVKSKSSVYQNNGVSARMKKALDF